MGGDGSFGAGGRATLLAFALACLVMPASSTAYGAHRVAARSKPGPVTLRGTAANVSAGNFTLRTKSSGTYSIQVVPATSITEKGKRGRQTVRGGDHVGVRGFVKGRSIRAIYVHIYPSRAKPKGYTLVGTVQVTGSGYLLVSSGGKSLRISVKSSTPVRVGSRAGSLHDVHAGDRVSIRVTAGGSVLVATHIHVYQGKSKGVSTQVAGTVVQVSSTSITVRQGSRMYQIALTGSTIVYRGASRTERGALRAGQSVRVYACCQGKPLVAHSIHIKKSLAPLVTQTVKGEIKSIGPHALVLSSPGGTVTIGFGSTTVFEVGLTHTPWTGLRLGDEVAVHAYRANGTLVASRVQVYISSRRIHHIIGTVLSVENGRLTVRARGKQYTIMPASNAGITVGGKRAAIGDVRPGDRVQASGRLNGTALTADSIAAQHPAPEIKIIRGTVNAVSGGGFSVTDSRGKRYQIRLAKGVHVMLKGQLAPTDALFAGVRVTVHGTTTGGVLVATAVTVSVTLRVISGRVRRVTAYSIDVAHSSGIPTGIDVPRGMMVVDRQRRKAVASLKRGTYLRVRGYVEASKRLRASAIHLLHPSLDITGAVTAVSPAVEIRTSNGELYRLAVSAQTQLSVERAQIEITAADIGVGMHVHALGTMRSDGALAVNQLDVRLASVTMRGKVASINGRLLSVDVSGQSQEVRLQSLTSIVQGSRTLATGDMVSGDDVTIYGYRSGQGAVIARKIDVHRKLVGIDGYVTSLAPDGFSITLSSGAEVRVITDATTQVTGGSTGMGLSVHVTGYQRGDGVILATRVRVGKAHKLLSSGGLSLSGVDVAQQRSELA